MRNLIYSCLFCLVNTLSYAQSIDQFVISSGGLFIEQGSYSLAYTVSQTVVETVTSANNILTQGFQQPEDFMSNVINLSANETFIEVYPNPANDRIFVNVRHSTNTIFKLQVYNLIGEEVIPATIFFNQSVNQISLVGLSKGTYLLRITGDDFTSVVKFLKAE